MTTLSIISELFAEAPSYPAAWSSLLEEIAALFACRGAQYLNVNTRTGEILLSIFTRGMDLKAANHCQIFWANHYPRFEHDNGNWELLHHQAVSATPERLLKPDFVDSAGIRHVASCWTKGSDDIVSALAFYWDAEQEQPGCRKINRWLASIRPQFELANRHYVELQQLRSVNMLWQTILDKFDYPILLVNEKGNIIIRNQCSEAWIAKYNIFGIKAYTLIANNNEHQERLEQIIHNTIHEDRHSVHLIRHNASGKTYQMMAVPIRVHGGQATGSQTAVMLVIGDQQGCVAITPEDVKSIYQFTTCEAKVAIALANGTSIEDFTAKSNVSIHTTRCHVRRALEKVGISKYSQMIKLMYALPKMKI